MRSVGEIWLDRSASATLQDQLVAAIRDLIQRAALVPAEELPSSRELAAELKVSRNTVVYAYDRLISEGYLESAPRSGVFVNSALALPPQPKGHPRSKGPYGRIVEATAEIALGTPRPFRPSQPDVTLFPLLTWNRIRGRVLRREGHGILHYQAQCVAGYPALRQGVAAYIREHRGVRCDWNHVVITAGSQQALFLLAMLLLRPGDRAYVEDPGYLESRLAWRRAGATVVSGSVDDQGLCLPTQWRGGMTLVYTTPSRQFPTGAVLSLTRRLALLELATGANAWIVEDDYDSELRYGAAPLPSLQSLDRNGRVIYVGTFSKLLFPSLRLGYVVLPDPLLDRFIELKHLTDDHLPLIDQATLASFLETGAFYSHIRRCRRAYAQRQAAFLRLFGSGELPLRFPYTDGGMNLAGFLPPGTDDRVWSQRLSEGGFDVPPLSRYAERPTRPGLVFGFTAFTPDVIGASFARVARILRGVPTKASRA